MSLALRTVDAETGIATITVNRPEVRNALDVPAARAICDAVLPLREMPDIRCVVLRGGGGARSSPAATWRVLRMTLTRRPRWCTACWTRCTRPFSPCAR